MAKLQKGERPNINGIPGTLVDNAPDIYFGRKNARPSPYDPLLLQLKAAGSGKFLRFESLSARPSLTARAKKLGIKILFGEEGQTLWVRLAEENAPVAAAPESRPPTLADEEQITIAFIQSQRGKRASAGEILTHLRSKGCNVAHAGLSAVDRMLWLMARQGRVKLGKLGVDDVERWEVA